MSVSYVSAVSYRPGISYSDTDVLAFSKDVGCWSEYFWRRK
jgi:hypothetical protein